MEKKKFSGFLWAILLIVILLVWVLDYFLEVNYNINFEELWIATSIVVAVIIIYSAYLHNKKITKKSESLFQMFKERSLGDKFLILVLLVLIILSFTAVLLDQSIPVFLTVFEDEELIILGISTLIIFIYTVYKAIINKW